MKDFALISFQFAKCKLGQPVTRKSSPFHEFFPGSGCYKSHPHSFIDREAILRIVSITTHKNAKIVGQRQVSGYCGYYGQTVENTYQLEFILQIRERIVTQSKSLCRQLRLTGWNPENHRRVDESYKRGRFDFVAVELFFNDTSKVIRQGI